MSDLPSDLSPEMQKVHNRAVKTLSGLNLTELQLQAVMNVVTDAALTAVDETIRRMVEKKEPLIECPSCGENHSLDVCPDGVRGGDFT